MSVYTDNRMNKLYTVVRIILQNTEKRIYWVYT